MALKVLLIMHEKRYDYLSANIFHGLSELDDVELYVRGHFPLMYKGHNPKELAHLYGKGFSYTNRINPKRVLELNDKVALDMIREKAFDTVIYGAVQREIAFLDDVLSRYEKDEVFFFDGEDSDGRINLLPPKGIQATYRDLCEAWKIDKRLRLVYGRGRIFKREIGGDIKYFTPVSFAIPLQDVVKKIPEKTKEMAFIYPGKKETYIYDTESEYYKGYREARFGTTFKKAGWDCMRHYEILANGCIPYFPGLEKCPRNTMHNFPKKTVLHTNKMYDAGHYSDSEYREYAEELLEYTRQELTTTALAKYIVSFCS